MEVPHFGIPLAHAMNAPTAAWKDPHKHNKTVWVVNIYWISFFYF